MTTLADVRTRRDPAVLLGTLTLALVAVLLSASIIVTYVAFGRQASRITKLERADRAFQSSLLAVDKELGRHSQAIQRVEALAQNAYQRGYTAGKRAQLLPKRLAELEELATRGFLVPRTIPRPLARTPFVVTPLERAYNIRWRNAGVAVFATASEPLSTWTRQAWPGGRRVVKIGNRSVIRLVGPFGLVHVWRHGGRTYAVLTLRETENLGRLLISTMR